MTIITDTFDFCKRCSVSSRTSSRRLKSKLEKGSSNKSKSGCEIIDRARATLCCSPPLNSCGYLSSEFGNLINSIISSTLLVEFFTLVGNLKFSFTVKCGNKA